MDNTALIKKIKWQLYLLGKFKIPMIGYTGLKLIEITDATTKVKIKLKRRTKNHLNSMYFGALAIGADGAGVVVGGTAGQVLAKIDGTDFNTEWVDPAVGSTSNSFSTISVAGQGNGM